MQKEKKESSLDVEFIYDTHGQTFLSTLYICIVKFPFLQSTVSHRRDTSIDSFIHG